MTKLEPDILLVEDSSNDAELLLRALRKSSAVGRVHLVKDGVEALDFAFCTGPYALRRAEKPLRLILLDLKLPKLDGMEVLHRLRGDQRTKLIPVVVLTSSQEETDILQCYRLGANSYVVKPVLFEKFVQTINELVSYWLSLNTLAGTK